MRGRVGDVGNGVGRTGGGCGGEEKSMCVVALSPYSFLSTSWALVPSGECHRDTLCSRTESFNMQRPGKR